MKKVIAHSYLEDIEIYRPGKDKIAGKIGEVIKLSSNENALGCCDNAKNSYESYSKNVSRYADGACSELRTEIAKKYAIESENIVCGAGSDEILYMLTAAYSGLGDEIIHSKHGFLMYGISAKRVGAKAVVVEEKNLKADIDAIISAVNDKTKIIFLANPNNPTGSYLTNGDVKKLIDNVPSDVLIVFDHAYDEYVVDLPDYPDAIEIVRKNKNVVMTRTFSKIYGLASLRIGWCYANIEIADILNKVRGPFNVSGSAQISAIESIKDDEFLQKSQIYNKDSLKKLFEEAKSYKKIKTHPSVANFILYDFGSSENAKKANQEFINNGVIVRQMDSYFLPNCLRITVGNDKENEILLNILVKIDEML